MSQQRRGSTSGRSADDTSTQRAPSRTTTATPAGSQTKLAGSKRGRATGTAAPSPRGDGVQQSSSSAERRRSRANTDGGAGEENQGSPTVHSPPTSPSGTAGAQGGEGGQGLTAVTDVLKTLEQRCAELQERSRQFYRILPPTDVVEFVCDGEVLCLEARTLHKVPGSLLFAMAVARRQKLDAVVAQSQQGTSRFCPTEPPADTGAASATRTKLAVPIARRSESRTAAVALDAAPPPPQSPLTPGGNLESSPLMNPWSTPQLPPDNSPLGPIVSTELIIAIDHHGTIPLDSNGRIIVDRDPSIFRIILNLLRGYGLNAHESLLKAPGQIQNLCEDLQYFLLTGLNYSFRKELVPELTQEYAHVLSTLGESSAAANLTSAHSLLGQAEWSAGSAGGLLLGGGTGGSGSSSAAIERRSPFLFQGPAVTAEGRILDMRCHQFATTIGPSLSSGVFHINFAVRSEGYALIGLITPATNLEDTPDFRDTPGCLSISTEGSVFFNRQPPASRVRYELGTPWSEGSEFGMLVNFKRRHVTWFRNDAVVTMCPLELSEARVAISLRRSAIEILSVTEYER